MLSGERKLQITAPDSLGLGSDNHLRNDLRLRGIVGVSDRVTTVILGARSQRFQSALESA